MKNPIKKTLAFLAMGLAASTLICQQAQAVPINGSIAFGGTGTGSTGGGTSTITFGTMNTSFGLLDYSGVPGGITVPFAPISWTGSGLTAVLTSSNSPEWTFVSNGTTYSFNLLTLTQATMANNGQLTLSGTGTAFIAGTINRDPTFSTFSVQGTGNGLTFQIVQASNSSQVPEGGSALALLGLGLVTVAAVRRKLAAA